MIQTYYCLKTFSVIFWMNVAQTAHTPLGQTQKAQNNFIIQLH